MSVSQLTAPVVRTPTCSVVANGSDILTGVIDVSVTNNSHFTADNYKLKFAVDGLPPGYDPAYWSNSPGDTIAITLGDGNGTYAAITGVVDDIELDQARQTLSLAGRDFSSKFLDTKTDATGNGQQFQEKTSSQIVQILAASQGLTASVTATKLPSGKYYELLHARLTHEQSQWDLMMFLAQQENYDLWVSGTTVYFQPPIADNTPPYTITWNAANKTANVEDLQLRRSQTLAKDIIVKVRSWNQAQGKTFTAEAKRSHTNSSSSNAQIYSYNIPNLTQAEAQQWANSKVDQISKHERVITGTLPGDSILNIRSLIQLTGTQTSFDQNYYPDTITRRMSVSGGYEMSFRAKNHSTESTVIT